LVADRFIKASAAALGAIFQRRRHSHLYPHGMRCRGPVEASMSHLRTAILLAGLTALFMGVGSDRSSGALIALAVAAAMNLFTYCPTDGAAMHGAQGGRYRA
jgi:hypothetical protein